MTKSKETLAKLAADYYYWVVQQVPLRQDNLFRTYLWLASLALTLAVLFFRYAPPPALSVTAVMLYASIATAMFAIIFCLFHMRGKIDFGFPDLLVYSAKMTGDDEEKFLTYLIEQYWELSQPGKVQMVQRARSLRATTWVLTSCFLLLTLAGIFSIPAGQHLSAIQGGDPIMAEEQSNPATDAQPVTPTSSQGSDKPAPSYGHSTHSDNGAGAQTFEVDIQHRQQK